LDRAYPVPGKVAAGFLSPFEVFLTGVIGLDRV